jgi:L-ascorbate metabolism protein UlaG (beta-lactamase superfamily)
MNRLRLTLPLLLGIAFPASGVVEQGTAPQDSVQSQIDLLFVANEGVLMTTSSGKVAIDCMFDAPNPAYAAPPAAMLRAMTNGTAPFDDLDLILLTHDHPDHYAPELVAQALSHNRRAVFVAPVDAVAALEPAAPDWASIRDRVVAVTIDVRAEFDSVINGIRVQAYRTLHSGARETPQNLVYLLEMDGRTIFHEGDSDGSVQTYEALGLAEKHIDLALVHFWFPTSQDGEAIILGVLKPRHVGLFHLPLRLESDAPTKIAEVARNYNDIFLLMEPGERKTIPD